MKNPSFFHRTKRGSAIITVTLLISIVALLITSIIRYSVSERRGNERHRLLLRARNMAENVSVYAAEQLTTKLYRLRSATPMAFMRHTPSVADANEIYLPPDDVITTTYTSPSDVEVYAGLVSSTGLQAVSNPLDTYYGLSVNSSLVPIISKASAQTATAGKLTAYVEQDFQLALIPLFQFAIFYNQDLEFSPGANMTISGPVHANGNLIARGQTGFSNTVQFRERVTASGGFYAQTGFKGTMYNDYDGADSGPGGTGPLYFQDPSGTVTDVYSGSIWRDYMWGNSSPTTSTITSFKNWATSTYSGNLRTGDMGVTALQPPGVDPTATGNSGRNIIEPANYGALRADGLNTGDADTVQQVLSKFSRNAGLYIIVNPTPSNRRGILPDGTTVRVMPFSYRCWLNTVSSSGSHTLSEVVLPGQPSYGYNDAGTAGVYTDDSMNQNDLPNRFTDKTLFGSNQVLRIPRSGRTWDAAVSATYAATPPNYPNSMTPSGSPVTYSSAPPLLTGASAALGDAFFYDLRRANNSNGHPFARGSTATTQFMPRPIAKIDFDMLRFRLAVERTVTGSGTASAIYWPNLPASSIGGVTTTNQWNAFMYNPDAARITAGTLKLGINYVGGTTPTDFGDFPVTGVTIHGTSPTYTADPYKMYFTDVTSAPYHAVTASDLINTSGACPWYDGITVYIQSVDAELRTVDASGNRDRLDSGVRLINGRGPIVSLDGTTYPGRTGMSFATNDAAYILGHYNADGSTTASSSSSTYSGRYPDSSAEKLTAIMADAVTILSQPGYSTSSGNYYQTEGWSDALSGHRRDNGGTFSWSSSWATTNPGSSNRQDGINTSTNPATLPYLTTGGSTGSSAQTCKFDTGETEISTCILTGIVPTDTHQHSGGVHNYPRLLEGWNGTALYIRGSMVAMFNSEVASEPWSLRIYNAATRAWGLHESLRDSNHDVPLEPILAATSRLRYYEITPTQYSDQKAVITALPH